MNIKEQKAKEFKDLAIPLIKYLRDNYHPHVTIIITNSNAELLEGQISTGEISNLEEDAPVLIVR